MKAQCINYPHKYLMSIYYELDFVLSCENIQYETNKGLPWWRSG